MAIGLDLERRFVAAVEAIYGAAPDPSRWPRALQSIADCFGDVGGNLIWRRDDGQFGVITSPSLEAGAAEYEREWWRQDIRAQRNAERFYWARGETATDRHLVSDEEVETHPFYTQFLARHGLKWVAGTGVSPDPHVMVGIAVQRLAAKPPFTDAELDVLTRLGRHVEKSLRLSIRLFDAELLKLGLGEALVRVGIGVFALDSLERVVFSNRAGQGLLGDGLDVIGERMVVGSPSERAAAEGAIRRMIEGRPEDLVADPKPILIQRRKTGRPLTVYVLPIRASTSPAHQFLTHARAIVLVIDPEADGPADPAVVRDVLGLTLGEARVASLVGSGLPPREAAEKLGISEETARTALKRVFSKVGVSRQSELTALLTKLVLR